MKNLMVTLESDLAALRREEASLEKSSFTAGHAFLLGRLTQTEYILDLLRQLGITSQASGSDALPF